MLYEVITREVAAQNERIAAAAKQAANIADQVASASEELSAQIEQSSRGADEQRNMTDETATAMEEMNATVLEVARNASQAAGIADNTRDKARQGANIVTDVIGAIGQIKDKAETLGKDMEGLGAQAESIGRVLDVISDIADQGDLRLKEMTYFLTGSHTGSLMPEIITRISGSYNFV